MDGQGAPTGCKVIKSSGSDTLDSKTCEVVMQRARFKPSPGSGRGSRTYRNTVRWVHPGWPEFVVKIIVGKNGAVESCELKDPDGIAAAFDPCKEVTGQAMIEAPGQRMELRLTTRLEARPIE